MGSHLPLLEVSATPRACLGTHRGGFWFGVGVFGDYKVLSGLGRWVSASTELLSGRVNTKISSCEFCAAGCTSLLCPHKCPGLEVPLLAFQLPPAHHHFNA